jgi:hypothetical protein
MPDYVPHFVVRTRHGPMTVLVLSHEHIQTQQRFVEAGFTGTIVPTRQGAIAVLAQGNADVDDAAEKFEQRIRRIQDSR